MKTLIRSVEKKDFEEILPLFLQLWQNKEINTVEIRNIV